MVIASPTRRACTVLDRIGNKWAICVIGQLAQGPRRFSELQRRIDGITARMLTVTLRGLEGDGILVRRIQAAAPPRVDYELTVLGATLLNVIAPLVGWAEQHLGEIEAARADYPARTMTQGPARGRPGCELALRHRRSLT